MAAKSIRAASAVTIFSVIPWPPSPLPLMRPRCSSTTRSGDHVVHQGELIVSASAAASVTQAFRLLFEARFPIRQMRVVEDFGGDDERSMLADNTSAFNCRLVPGTSVWAQHAYGLAVDINPFENPEIQDGKANPPAAAVWGGPVTFQPGDDQRGGRRLARLPRHRLRPGRGLALAEGLHAFLRQRTVNASRAACWLGRRSG